MKRLTGLLCATACCMLSGCALDYTYTEADLKNEYLVNWIMTYGLIDPDHDWNMAQRVEMVVNPNDFGHGSLVCIYTDDPLAGGELIGRTSTPQVLKMDVLKGTKTLYVRAYNEQRTSYVNAIATIKDGKAELTGLSRAQGTDEGGLVDSESGTTKIAYNWLLVCEDLGTMGDTDFNDIVLGLSYVAGETSLTITPLAAGGTLEAYVRFGNKELGEIHGRFGVPTTTMHNTKSWDGPAAEPWVETVPPDFSVTDKMGGISLRIKRPDGDKLAQTIIEAPSELGEAPSILCVPGNWEWPTEGTSIHTAYPGFTNWSQNNTLSDWMNRAADNGSKVIHRNNTTNSSSSQLLKRTMTIDGVTREYMLYIPANSSANTALMVSLHGASNHATDYMPLKYDANVIDADYIIAYPQGLDQDFGPFGTVPGWDAVRSENIDAYAPIQQSVDTKFLRLMVDDIAKTYKFDHSRVYCCGFSNGGMMAYAAAATMSDVFAACAAIEGFPVNEFHLLTSGPRPVPFLHIHGTEDHFVDYDLYPVIRDCMVARNGCNPVPTTTTYDESGRKYTRRVYTPETDGADFVTYEVVGLGHYYASENLDHWNTTKVMWNFLKDKRLSTTTNNLEWRLNIDAPGWDPNGSGWDKWDIDVNADKTRYVIGHAPAEGNTTNVYPAIQFAPGYHRLEYSTTGNNANSVHLDLVNVAGGSAKVHGSSQVGTTASVTFYVFSNGNYKLTIAKDDPTDKFTNIAIYRADGEADPVNHTPDAWQ